jgi:hypothetical protein
MHGRKFILMLGIENYTFDKNMLQKISVVIIKISASLLTIASPIRRPTFSSQNNTLHTTNIQSLL